MKKISSNYNRRRFIKTAGCAAMGSTTLLSSLLNLRALNASAMNSSSGGGDGDYKALVCIMLAGGMDSYNLLVPQGNAEYNEYALTRGNLALPQNELLPLYPTIPDGKDYGVHPSAPQIQNLFNTGKLAFVRNTGTLIYPTTKAQYQNDSVQLPIGLMSHSDQLQQWQTGRPHERTGTGWGGRMADLISSMNSNSNISMNISLSGSNVFQHGVNNIDYVIDTNGSIGISGYNGTSFYDSLKTAALNNMLDASYSDIFKQSYVNTLKSGNDASEEFQSAIDLVPPFLTSFSPNTLSEQLEMIAKVISARESLGFSRQTFFVEYHGWDHHDDLISNQEDMLPELSLALAEFNAVLEEMNISDSVTTFTISDFARTLTSNGNGSDHAWGGNVMIMGGSVNGGELYGSYPSLELGNPLDVGNGVLIPTTSTDEYLSELAVWFGVPVSDLPLIFPNLSNFYSYGTSSVPPLGFLNI